MSDERLDREAIRARAEGATPGPWMIDATPGFTHHVRTGGTTATVPTTGEPVADAALDDDATFIAHARQDVPVLLDACDALAGALRELIEACDDCQSVEYQDGVLVSLGPCGTHLAVSDLLDRLGYGAGEGEG